MITLLVRRNLHVLAKHSNNGRLVAYLATKAATASQQNNGYTDTPEYPPIMDLSYKARKKREAESWHEKIRLLSSVEEKLFEINMPKYYGYKSHMITDRKVPYNALPLAQFATRTHLVEGTLPDFYSTLRTEIGPKLLAEIKSSIEDTIAFELSTSHDELNKSEISPVEREEVLTLAVLRALNRLLLNQLSGTCPHLGEVEIDFEPRHEAFWFVGGMKPPALVKKIKEGQDWQKSFANDPFDRKFQYTGRPYLALRHKHLLEPLVSDNLETLNIREESSIELPEYRYDPLTLGYSTEQRHATTIPGFWPGDQHEFGLISFQRRSHALNRHTYCAENDLQEALHAQGIYSSFAWLFGQACYQGFSTFNDLTYPLTTQTVITDGQRWSFYAYQLNTTLVHSDQVDVNPRFNRCWATQEQKLYDHIDGEGKVHGFNDEVLLNLICFYANAPKPRGENLDLKPYLCKQEPRVADIVDEKRRVFMEQAYKHIASTRPRHRLIPEVYLWEKIYKIDHNTRAMEARRRPFELEQNMYKRRMDEHAPRYIPRAVRPGGPKSKPRFEATYYPTVRRQA